MFFNRTLKLAIKFLLVSSFMLPCACGAASRAADIDGKATGITAGLTPYLSAFDNHPVTTTGRREALIKLLQAQGTKKEDILFQNVWVGLHREVNLIVKLPGMPVNVESRFQGKSRPEVESSNIIVVGAHYDVMDDSPGLIDNWSGSVMLAALCNFISAKPRNHDFYFVAFAGEEHGQHGSRTFIRRLGRAERGRVKGMVNLECLGVEALRTWSNRSEDDLEIIFHRTAADLGVRSVTQVLFGYTADSASFSDIGIPAVTIHSLAPRSLAIINTPEDDGRHFSKEKFTEAYRVLSEYLLRIDDLDATVRFRNAEAKLEPVDSDTGARYRESDVGGVEVLELGHDSVEYIAGLRKGDVVVAVDNNPIRRPGELRQALLTFYKGKAVVFSVIRPGAKEKPIKVAAEKAGDSEKSESHANQNRKLTVDY